MILRKKVMHKLPVKTVLGHAVNGSTWVSMLQSYAEAFNSGKVPNIESSWHNLCQSRAQNGLSAAVNYVEKEFE
jgi:hypothetical protein